MVSTERETNREIYRQTDRQTQTGRHTDTYTDNQTDTDSQRERHIEKHTERDTARKKETKGLRETEWEIKKDIDIQTEIYKDGRRERQADRDREITDIDRVLKRADRQIKIIRGPRTPPVIPNSNSSWHLLLLLPLLPQYPISIPLQTHPRPPISNFSSSPPYHLSSLPPPLTV